MTFRDFVEESGNAIRPKDKLGEGPEVDDRVCRIAAARVSRWLEDFVLAGQEILVDAPYLVARFPSLLSGKNISRPETWNKTAQLLPSTKVGIKHESLAPFEFSSNWLSRPAWLWAKIARSREILEVREPLARRGGELVFCEDVSRFMPRNQARQFLADVASAHLRRYVVDPAMVTDSMPELQKVMYHPSVRFSM
jgi:hypothetical protein